MRVVGDFVKLSGEKQHRNTSADLKSARFSSGLFFSLLPGRRALYLKIPALSGHAQKACSNTLTKRQTQPARPTRAVQARSPPEIRRLSSRSAQFTSLARSPATMSGTEKYVRIRISRIPKFPKPAATAPEDMSAAPAAKLTAVAKTRSADRSSLPLPSGCCFVDCLTIARPLRLPFLRGSFYPAQVIFFPCILCTKAPPLRLAFLHKSHSFVKNNGDLRKARISGGARLK